MHVVIPCELVKVKTNEEDSFILLLYPLFLTGSRNVVELSQLHCHLFKKEQLAMQFDIKSTVINRTVHVYLFASMGPNVFSPLECS